MADRAPRNGVLTGTTMLDPVSFRRAMGLFPTGVAIISCGAGESTEAVTANSLTSVSLDPLLLLVSIRSDGKIRGGIERSRRFGVSLLHERQRELSRHFASGDRAQGSAAAALLGGPVGVAGNVLVDDALATLDCELEVQYRGGDHELFVGRVVGLRIGDERRRPLLYHRGGYGLT
jgi:3-hydroxy-9,10-secoandrosta-1,3,5(10)-triene-9,17-dione monooxygenase reductase component